jgi:hypothetical protein
MDKLIPITEISPVILLEKVTAGKLLIKIPTLVNITARVIIGERSLMVRDSSPE